MLKNKYKLLLSFVFIPMLTIPIISASCKDKKDNSSQNTNDNSENQNNNNSQPTPNVPNNKDEEKTRYSNWEEISKNQELWVDFFKMLISDLEKIFKTFSDPNNKNDEFKQYILEIMQMGEKNDFNKIAQDILQIKDKSLEEITSNEKLLAIAKEIFIKFPNFKEIIEKLVKLAEI
ncbi:hypothetical protein [Metamycoplasma alkalescens]|uniref:Lipoprotein n=1 Tax=Metamycoplasma alkalescens TaxID=45363 RepID=A0A318U4K1_9BACT|nr:hypothetical protein [Metamycoplasma alkalescens]PYF42571.1 hypothetical protein BCF88_11026 [Metamycoplasma alkalescens]